MAISQLHQQIENHKVNEVIFILLKLKIEINLINKIKLNKIKLY